jgi:chromosomal replication initiation ATPase DnaA
MQLQSIITSAAELFEVDAGAITSRSRDREITAARQAIYYALYRRRRKPLSLARIGQILGRDHTTVSYGVQIAEQRAEHDADYRAALDLLLEVPHV